MNMSMGMSQSLHQEQRLSHEQRMEHQLTMRLALIEAVGGAKYTPVARCPKCTRELKPVEILKGFNNNPTDFTTECTGCHHRFQPNLRTGVTSGYEQLLFYCPLQTLDQLPQFSDKKAEIFRKEQPSLFHSAIVHFGSVTAAFAKIGVTYAFEEITDWSQKIRPFLGKISDAEIGRAVNQNPKRIGRLRRQLGIPIFSYDED